MVERILPRGGLLLPYWVCCLDALRKHTPLCLGVRSLCLSRACLGKNEHFLRMKWLKKGERSSHPLGALELLNLKVGKRLA